MLKHNAGMCSTWSEDFVWARSPGGFDSDGDALRIAPSREAPRKQPADAAQTEPKALEYGGRTGRRLVSTSRMERSAFRAAESGHERPKRIA